MRQEKGMGRLRGKKRMAVILMAGNDWNWRLLFRWGEDA